MNTEVKTIRKKFKDQPDADAVRMVLRPEVVDGDEVDVLGDDRETDLLVVKRGLVVHVGRPEAKDTMAEGASSVVPEPMEVGEISEANMVLPGLSHIWKKQKY